MKVRWLAVFLLVFSNGLLATTHDEKQELQRINRELDYLVQDVYDTSRLRRSDDVEQFHYEALIRDLREMRAAIKRHLNNPSRQPKKLTPLEFDYGHIR